MQFRCTTAYKCETVTLCRFDNPTTETITVDGCPLNQLDLNTWRNRIAIDRHQQIESHVSYPPEQAETSPFFMKR